MRHTVTQAREIARQWVDEKARGAPGFAGAFLHGSINDLPDDATLSATSDVDVMVVMSSDSDTQPSFTTGKFIYNDALLEVSSIAVDRLQSAGQVLSNYQLASSFRRSGILADSTGHLTALQAAVGRDFARRDWVRRRCEDARDKAQRDLESAQMNRLFSDAVLAWLFGTGKLAHLPLVAGLQNPTVRRRYVTVREQLEPALYTDLLALLGWTALTAEQVEQQVAALAEVFDVTATYRRTPFPFMSDISAAARSIAIDGSYALISAGDHREAVFWIAVTYSRCMTILHHDAPSAVYARYESAYCELLAGMGIRSAADLESRREQARAFLPRIWAATESILAANPAVED